MTPNGDGMNDIFEIRYIDLYDVKKVDNLQQMGYNCLSERRITKTIGMVEMCLTVFTSMYWNCGREPINTNYYGNLTVIDND